MKKSSSEYHLTDTTSANSDNGHHKLSRDGNTKQPKIRLRAEKLPDINLKQNNEMTFDPKKYGRRRKYNLTIKLKESK